MIEAAEVARKYAGSRPGFELVHYEEVGIPYYRLVLDSLVQLRKPIGPIDEFVLRAVAGGVETLDDVAGLLGVERPLIEQTVVRMNRLDHLDYRVEGARRVLRITALGSRALGGWIELTPDRQEIMVGFDRLTWQVTGRHFRALIRPKEARDRGYLDLPPKLKKRLVPSDLDPDDVQQALRALLRNSLRDADVISIVDAGNFRMALPAVALVFAATSGDDQQVGIAIDGRLSEAHELAFGEIDGPARSGLVVDEMASPDEVPDLADDLRLQRVERGKVAELEARVAHASSEVDRARTATSTAAIDESPGGLADARELEARSQEELAAARGELGGAPIRAIQTYEHRVLLSDALATAKERLLIISPWIRGDVVDGRFIAELRACLRRRVRVHIGWGIGDEEHMDDRSRTAVQNLSKLVAQHENASLHHLGNTHAKVLIWDGNLVVTSFNWLSFRADKRRGYRQEEGTLIVQPDYVEHEYQKYRGQISAGRPS